MNNELLSKALSEKRHIQEQNRLEEERRVQAVSQAHPDIGKLIDERRAAILEGLNQALRGITPLGIEEQTRVRNERIEALLTRYGYGRDYLSPIHDCERCQDSGYAGESKKTLCRCVALRYQALMQGSANGQAQTFDSYDDAVFPLTPLPGSRTSQRAYTRLLRDQCEAWADALPNSPTRALLLYGKSGLGKTFLLRAVGERALSRGVGTLALTANALLNQIRQHYFGRDVQGEAGYMTVPLLLIDDLGTEPLWENITVEQLFALIDHRLNQGLHTLISTNLSPEELSERYTERIMSRLSDQRLCQWLAFIGQDVRLRPAQK